MGREEEESYNFREKESGYLMTKSHQYWFFQLKKGLTEINILSVKQKYYEYHMYPAIIKTLSVEKSALGIWYKMVSSSKEY